MRESPPFRAGRMSKFGASSSRSQLMLVGAKARRVAIVGGVRIPFVRGNGAYAQVGNQEMLTFALRGVVERHGLQGQRLDDVAAGAVMKHSSQWNLTRESVRVGPRRRNAGPRST